MQHSSNLKKNRIVKVIIFVVAFLAINDVFSLFLEPLETASEVMLTRYSNKVSEKEIDTLIIGNSVTSMIDDEAFSRATGMQAFNMGTPSQSFNVSFDILKMANRHNKIQKAILMTGFEAFEKAIDDIPERTFEKVIISSYPMRKRILYRFIAPLERAIQPNNIKQPDSINAFVSWIGACVDYPPTMWESFTTKVKRAFSGHRLGENIAFDLDKEIYKTTTESRTEADNLLLEEDIKRLHSLGLPQGTINDDALKTLDDISVYCRDNNIELYYFISPHQLTHIDRYGENYQKITDFLAQFMRERHFTYYNFETDPTVHATLPDNYYIDWEHISNDYVDEATEVIDETFNSMIIQ